MAILKVKDENGNIIEIPAIQGKSAYDYAKDGGYTGTEEEFAELLGSVDSTVVKVKTYSASFATTNVAATSEATFDFDLSELDGCEILARIPYIHHNGYVPATVKLGGITDTITSVRVYNVHASAAITYGSVYLAVLYKASFTTESSSVSGLNFEFDTESEEYKGQVSIGNKGTGSSAGAIRVVDYNSNTDYYMTTEIGNVDGGIKISGAENGEQMHITNEGFSRISGKPIYVNEHNLLDAFENKVLWSGSHFMTHTQTAFLTETISTQPTGIVLAFSYYENDTAYDIDWVYCFVPKIHVSLHSGRGVSFTGCTSDGLVQMLKYLYISDDRITGYEKNSGAFTASGISIQNNKYVLRYVIGV